MTISLRSNKGITVQVSVSNSGKIQTTTPITLRNTTGVGAAKLRLEDLINITSTGVRLDGQTVVYNANTNSYEIKAVQLDGGEY